MNYNAEYQKWCSSAVDEETISELNNLDTSSIKDAFYRDLVFGTGGLRGIIGVGTNRMNIYTVAKASQGLASYLGVGSCVVIGYDSRIKSDIFAKTTAGVFAANGIDVWFWPELNPVPLVSYAVRKLKASAGVMITASHNPSDYNGYKVYGADGCQITTEAATDILACISKIDIFSDVNILEFDDAVLSGKVKFIDNSLLDAYLLEVKGQSVLFGDEVDRDVAIVYSPLNGTGLKPVTRVLKDSGFTNITVVEEQREPNGSFPTCPCPNPELKEAMSLGLEYCRKTGADLLLATDPDCDRCGIAVRDGDDYKLLSGNEVGLLILDYICNQRIKHNKMPDSPVFIKTIVTTDLAQRIASYYGVHTINVLTGFKFIGEQIGRLNDEKDYICGFEESYGYLTGSFVRDKDGVNAAFMICEMLAYYKIRGVTLLKKLEDIYKEFGYCLNTLNSYTFAGAVGAEKIESIMTHFRNKLGTIAGDKIITTYDYINGINGLPPSNVLKYVTKKCSVVIRPSGTEPKLKVYISITAKDLAEAEYTKRMIINELEEIICCNKTVFDKKDN